MRAEAEPKPRRRRNESPCGAPVARFAAWVGPACDAQSPREEGINRRSNAELTSLPHYGRTGEQSYHTCIEQGPDKSGCLLRNHEGYYR